MYRQITNNATKVEESDNLTFKRVTTKVRLIGQPQQSIITSKY